MYKFYCNFSFKLEDNDFENRFDVENEHQFEFYLENYISSPIYIEASSTAPS